MFRLKKFQWPAFSDVLMRQMLLIQTEESRFMSDNYFCKHLFRMAVLDCHVLNVS